MNDSTRSVESGSDTPPPPTVRASLRLWPALAIVVAMLVATFGIGLVYPGTTVQFMAMMFGPMVGGVLLLIWWLAFSRAPWLDRLAATLIAVLAGWATYHWAHTSVVPLGLLIYGIPVLGTAFVGWLWLTGRWSLTLRRWTTGWVIVAASCIWALVRCDGLDGGLAADLSWRWTPTQEQRYLANLPKGALAKGPVGVASTEPLEAGPDDWPAFRGAMRDGAYHGAAIHVDWQASPLQEVWRQPIGPAWSSFCVIGNRAFTQEQLDQDEAVVCYDAERGERLWTYTYPARFAEVIGGVGPRATPTFHQGNLYTLGGTGILNCLNATTGKLVWTRDLAQDTGAKTPEWGFASSPLIVGDSVVVFAGAGAKDVAAYNLLAGEPKWTAQAGRNCYSSPQLLSPTALPQILMLTNEGIVSLTPENGGQLWEHHWPCVQAARIVQPHVIEVDANHWRVLLGTGYGIGTRLLTLSNDGDTWEAKEEWTSTHLKPYFNDFVSHDGYLYGFDGNILTCIDLESGERRWKGGRYGNGQLLLLARQGQLLVVSEKGDLAIVAASPDRFQQLTRMKALHGKTWNHPVISHGKLFVRNGEEAVCYQENGIVALHEPRGEVVHREASP